VAQHEQEQARSNLALAQADYERYADLVTSGAVSRQTFEQFQTKYEFAQATYEQAGASVRQAPMLYIMPGLLYSGLSWPPFDMSSFAAAFGALLPMTYAGDALRDIMLSGYAPDLTRNVGIMLLFFIIGGWQYSRRLRRLRTSSAQTEQTVL